MLDDIDDKVDKMYGTIDLKLRHVSKSLDAKFEQYDVVIKSNQTKLNQQLLEL